MTQRSITTNLAGKLLIAMPSITDANFERSVVFMCAHNKQGAMGFVLNKPAPLMQFADLIETTGVVPDPFSIPEDVLRLPVRIGGPVETSRGFVLHDDSYSGDASSLRVNGGLMVSATVDVLVDIAKGGGPHQRVITLGYAGWSSGQLENEIMHNGWLHCDADDAVVFNHEIDHIYGAALAKLGVDPAMLSTEAGHA
jgi:putative transcriptional regulator